MPISIRYLGSSMVLLRLIKESCQGLKVLIVEKKQLPRYKPCAGGLTRRALNILPFDISGVVESHSYSATMSIHNRPVFIKTDNHPIVAMVMRDKLDYFLVRKAISEGARLLRCADA